MRENTVFSYIPADYALVDQRLRDLFSNHLRSVRVASVADQEFATCLDALPFGWRVYKICWDEHALAITFPGFNNTIRIINSDDAYLKFGEISPRIIAYDNPPDETGLRYENAAILRAMEPGARRLAVSLVFSNNPRLGEETCKTHPALSAWYQQTDIPKHEHAPYAHFLLSHYKDMLQNKTYLRLSEKAELLRFFTKYMDGIKRPRLDVNDDSDFVMALNGVIDALNRRRTGWLLPSVKEKDFHDK